MAFVAQRFLILEIKSRAQLQLAGTLRLKLYIEDFRELSVNVAHITWKLTTAKHQLAFYVQLAAKGAYLPSLKPGRNGVRKVHRYPPPGQITTGPN